MSNENEQQLDELLNELAKNPPGNSKSPAIQLPKTIQKFGKDKELEEFITDNAQKNINELFQVIVNLSKDAGDDPEKLAALATLVSSNTNLLRLLNQRLTQNKDITAKLQMLKLKLEHSKIDDIIDLEGSVTSTRELAFKKILEETEKEEKDEDADEENQPS